MPGKGISDGKALVLETIVTALFLVVITTVATDRRAPWHGVFAPLAIGLFIFTALTAVGPMSGGSFNPARSIAPALVSGHLDGLWIFIVGPLLGGLIGGAIHLFFDSSAADTSPVDDK